MKCKRCGSENPQGQKRCMYCHTPFYGEYSNINMPKGSNKRKKNIKSRNNQTDTVIITAIIVLSLILTSIVGVFAFQSFAPGEKGFSGGSGGGAGGGAIISNTQRPSNSNDAAITLDDDDPDVEIYSFNTDTYDILVGETKKVTFTAEIFANIELGERDVTVMDDNGTSLGYMNDNGIDGDVIADDGIYTLQKEFTAEKIRNTLYYATVKNIHSNDVNICYYRLFNDEDFNAAENMVAKLREASSPFLNEDKTVEIANLSVLTTSILNYLKVEKQNNVINKYNIVDGSVRITLKDGYVFNYNVGISGVSSNGSQLHVASYAPFDGLRGNMEALYDEALDGTAKNIGNVFENYIFSRNNNYDLNDVSLETVKKLSKNSVILWGGHGGYDNSNKGYGSSLMTGQLVDRATTSKYSADITSDRIIVGYSAEGRDAYCITGGFVEKYVENMDGAFVYLSACYSGKDMLDGKKHRYQLVQSLINKGASSIVGNSDSIGSNYTYTMQRDIINRMCENNGDNFYSVSEALAHAKEVNGQNDNNFKKAKPVIFPENNNAAANYRFDTLKKGYISGIVKDASNSNLIKNALVRVYQEGRLIKSVRTDDNGMYNISVAAGNCLLKITKGKYKTTKISVDVTENITTYVETLLMIDAGINSGFAGGLVTDAVSGQNVSEVNINLRKSWNNRDGSVVKTTITNENGYYELSFLPGIYTIEFSKEGYITGYKNIIIGIVGCEDQNAVISPELPEDGNFRIVLSWSNKPKDLDSHLTGPMTNGDRFHLYYKYANTNNNNNNMDYFQLDLDNTDIFSKPNIPETTTIVMQLEGVYRYSVHDYSNRGNANSSEMAESNATVNVYKGAVLIATYHIPPTAKGSIWTVFELSGDTITPINKIGNGYEDDSSLF